MGLGGKAGGEQQQFPLGYSQGCGGLCHPHTLPLTSILSGRWQLALAQMPPTPPCLPVCGQSCSPQTAGSVRTYFPHYHPWLPPPLSMCSRAGSPLELAAFFMWLFPSVGFGVQKRGWREWVTEWEVTRLCRRDREQTPSSAALNLLSANLIPIEILEEL